MPVHAYYVGVALSWAGGAAFGGGETMMVTVRAEAYERLALDDPEGLWEL